MDTSINFSNEVFEIEPDEQGLLVEFAFLPSGSHGAQKVPMRIKGTLDVTILDGMSDDKRAAAKQAVRDQLVSGGKLAGAMLSSDGKTPQDLVADPSLVNMHFGMGFAAHNAELASYSVAVSPIGIKVTSAVIADGTAASETTTGNTTIWTCAFCGTTGHTGKFCENCGAPKQH